jgi:hypothetical protein
VPRSIEYLQGKQYHQLAMDEDLSVRENQPTNPPQGRVDDSSERQPPPAPLSDPQGREEHDFTLRALFPGNVVAILVVTSLLVLLLPILLIRGSWWSAMDFSSTGQIGDTIGGITAPLIGLLGTVLLYITIRLQWMGLMQERQHRHEDAIENEKRHREIQDRIDIKYILERIEKLDLEVDDIAGKIGSLQAYPKSGEDPRIAQLTIWALEVKFLLDWIAGVQADTFMVRRKLGVNYRIKY